MQPQLIKSKITEAMMLRAVMQFLDIKNIFHYRQNSGAYRPESGGFVRFGCLGSADLCCIYPGGRMWQLEVKRPGGLLSDGQIAFLKRVRLAGGLITVAESIDDVDKSLKDPGYIGLERYRRLLV